MRARGTVEARTFSLAGPAVRWYRIDGTPFLASYENFLDIGVEGGDIAIGVYNNQGELIASDHGEGVAEHAALSFGVPLPSRPSSGPIPFDGRDGERCCGIAYLAIALEPATFGPSGFAASSTATENSTSSLRIEHGRMRWESEYWYFDREEHDATANNLPADADWPGGDPDYPLPIMGRLRAGTDVDIYAVRISNPAAFAASVTCAYRDIALYLLDHDGRGLALAANVQNDPAGVSARLTNSAVGGASTYLLAVTTHPRVPLGCEGAALWQTGISGIERGPDGPGSACIVTGWTGDAALEATYTLEIEGCVYWPCNKPCPGDFDGSGGVDGDDIFAFFEDWQRGSPCADIDQSGGVDGYDINRFFYLWEGSC